MLLAGHKGHPEIVAQQGRAGRRLKGKPGRGTLAGEKPPILAMMQRGGEVFKWAGQFLTMNTRAMGVWSSGVIGIIPSITPRASMPWMMTSMGFVRPISTRWKAFGRACAHGYAHIAAFPKNIDLCTWPALSSFTMRSAVARRFYLHFCPYS